MDTSLFKLISVGYVAENKVLSENLIEVVPIEMLGYLDGEVKAEQQLLTAQGVDANGVAYQCSVNMSVSIRAKWLQEGNRVTAPDVQRGNQVNIYQFSDTDEYYWSQLGATSQERCLETAEWAFSGTQDRSQTDLTTDNSYRAGISAHKGIIHLTTSKANGEKVAYNIQINPKDGVFVVADDLGNFLQMDSLGEDFTYQNKSGTLINVEKENLTLEAKGNISIKAGKDIIINGKNITATATQNMTLGSKSYMLQTTTMSWSYTTGTMGSGGGSATVTGTFNFNDGITHKGKSIGIDHNHTEQGDGKATSGVN